jgi:hypothetical protein
MVGSRIRTQLIVLAAMAVLPLFLAFAYDVFQQAEEGFARARANSQRLAKIAAADAQGYFARTEQRLGDIARWIEDGSLDPGRCRALFSDAKPSVGSSPPWPWWTGTAGWFASAGNRTSRRWRG